MLLGYFTYLAVAGSILPGKIVAGATLSDGTRLHYRCNGRKYGFPYLCVLSLSSYGIFSFSSLDYDLCLCFRLQVCYCLFCWFVCLESVAGWISYHQL